MSKERRKAERVKVDLRVYWEGSLTQLEGSIVDLSITGCFILSDDRLRVGELIRVEIQPPKQGPLHVWGEVIYQIPEMGFAVHFTGADDDDLKRLGWLIKAELHLSKKTPSKQSAADEYFMS
ncbi:MAG: PilZ domain-containing protein [Acidobacteria bacterium]|jgi:hypothetical protein|nr:PilZ domain-containing protein [Acidobacteriota bacterium]